MRISLLLLFFAFGVASAQESELAMRKETVSGKLEIPALRELKSALRQHYGKDLDSVRIITIFYYQPKANCGIDIYKKITPDRKAPNDILRNIQSDVLFLCFEKDIQSAYIQNDVNATVYNTFFSAYRDCDGLVTVDNRGNFRLRKGKGTLSAANFFIRELRSKP